MNRKERRATKTGKAIGTLAPLATGSTDDLRVSRAAAGQLLEVHLAHGISLLDQGEPEQAEASFRRALAIGPHPVATMNLGIALALQDKHAEAMTEFQHAVKLDPRSAIALTNLARASLMDGDVGQALEMVWRALAIEETDDAKVLFIECLRQIKFTVDAPELRGLVARAVSECWQRLDDFSRAATDLTKVCSPLAAAVARVAAAWPQRLVGEELWAATEQVAICADPLLHALLISAPLCDIGIERFLTSVRLSLLRDAIASDSEVALPLLEFYCALARQCFITEYVWDCDAAELERVEGLQRSVSEALNSQSDIAPLRLVALASYVPLYSLPPAQAFGARSWPPAITNLLTQQIDEPLKEAQLRIEMPQLTRIENSVSLAVRAQYEENPYPRWTRFPSCVAANTAEGWLHTLFPSLRLQAGTYRERCDILIAGCGTGYHSIEAAKRYCNSVVLGVDLSRASLAYAVRKTREIGLPNVQYGQADLLHIEAIGRTFDVIEAGGVLHHLEDPFGGWRALAAVLRPGGFMYVGLYSASGRRDVTAIRDLIDRCGYGETAEQIRRFRQDLIAGADTNDFSDILRVADFFSGSGCRDLLFHRQERPVTIPQIAEFLDETDLDFLGFVVDARVLRHFTDRFPGNDNVRDFAKWHLFERENPKVFAGQYHLWLQRRA